MLVIVVPDLSVFEKGVVVFELALWYGNGSDFFGNGHWSVVFGDVPTKVAKNGSPPCPVLTTYGLTLIFAGYDCPNLNGLPPPAHSWLRHPRRLGIHKLIRSGKRSTVTGPTSFIPWAGRFTWSRPTYFRMEAWSWHGYR